MSATDSILKKYANENDYWVNYINNDIKQINMNVVENNFLNDIHKYDRSISSNIYDIQVKRSNITELERENSNYTERIKTINNIDILALSNKINIIKSEIIRINSNKKIQQRIMNDYKQYNTNLNYTQDTVNKLNNTEDTKILQNNNDINIINKLIKNEKYKLNKNEIMYDLYVLNNYNSIRNKINNIKDKQESNAHKENLLKNEKKNTKRNNLKDAISNNNKDIKKLNNDIDIIISDLNKYKNTLERRNNQHNTNKDTNNNILKYNTAYNLVLTHNESIENKRLEMIDISYFQIPKLKDEIEINNEYIEINMDKISKINNEINELNILKNKNSTMMNTSIKDCNTKSTNIIDELIQIKNKYTKCKDNTICSDTITKSLCENNSIFCNDWFTNITSYFNNFMYTNTCNQNIINKDVIEDFTNYTVIEGMDNNPNKANDITNNKYYSNILNKTTNIEDISQNIRRNIEIDLFYIEKYNAQINILKYIIFICCIALFGSILYHNGLLTSDLYTGYLSLVFGIGTFIILYYLFNIFIRNSNRYNEYDYEFIYKPPTIGDPTYNAVELSNLPSDC